MTLTVSSGYVPVREFYSEISLSVHAFKQSGRESHGSVLSARTAYRDNELVFPFPDIIRYQKLKKVRDLIKELLRFGKTHDIIPDFPVKSRKCFLFIDIEGVWQEPYIKYKVCIKRNAVFKAKRNYIDHQAVELFIFNKYPFDLAL